MESLSRGAQRPFHFVLFPRGHRLFSLAAWLSLVVLALYMLVFVPFMQAARPRPDISIALFAAGIAFLLLSLIRRLAWLRWMGAALLWFQIALGLLTQILPFGTPLGVSLGSPGIKLVVLLSVWALLLQPRPWIARGVLAGGLVTAVVLAVFWLASPPVTRTISTYWLSVDSYGRLYAAETDLGVIWVFDNAGMRSTLWPRRAGPGELGPGLQPASIEESNQLSIGTWDANTRASQLVALAIPFYGLAVDPQDYLYVVDPDRLLVQQFSRDGYQVASWSLPSSFVPANGCLAADSERVYVADLKGSIYVYDHAGHLLEQWETGSGLSDMTIGVEGQVYVMKEGEIHIYEYPGGRLVKQIVLNNPHAGLVGVNGSFVVESDGSILAADAVESLLHRFSPDGEDRGVLGSRGPLPSRTFTGAMPGQFIQIAGIAEDRQHHIYVSDLAYGVIQRFSADKVVDQVIAVPEQAAGDTR